MNELEAAKAKQFWEGTEGRWKTSKWEHWLQHAKVKERINALVSGDPRKDCFQYFLERYFRGRLGRRRRVKRALTLGCGYGEFERGLSQYKFARIHEALDISIDAVAEASKLASAGGFEHIRYRVGDLNRIELSKCIYDVVFGISSIHHVSELRHLFLQVALSLKPGGYFFLDEYIGPSKFQWTDDQLAIINEQIAMLPPDLRLPINGSVLKGAVWRMTLQEMDAADPSEAIHSADILQLLPQFFDIVEVKGYGGSLLHVLLEGIAGNFVEDDPRSMAYLRSFFEVEDQRIASGRLQHDFAVIVARRKPTRVQKVLGCKIAYLVSKTRAVLREKGARAAFCV